MNFGVHKPERHLKEDLSTVEILKLLKNEGNTCTSLFNRFIFSLWIPEKNKIKIAHKLGRRGFRMLVSLSTSPFRSHPYLPSKLQLLAVSKLSLYLGEIMYLYNQYINHHVPKNIISSTASRRSEDGSSKVLRKVAILPQHYTASQPSEDGSSKVLRNVAILSQHYTASQPSEDGSSKVPRNVGILPQHYNRVKPQKTSDFRSSGFLG
jgi:hypothetical protein